jgi:HEPN domain-containing protein
LDDARYLAERGSYAPACFNAQQAAEKALIAYLVFVDGDKPHTHRTADLLKTSATFDPTLAASLTDAAGLDPYYGSTRYPDAISGALPAESFYSAESEKAIERASRVLDAVSARLPKP